MERSYLTFLAVFVASIALLFATSHQGIATTFSGRVVDEAGKPVSGIKLALPAFRVTTPQDQEEPVFIPSQQGETNEAGEFLISDINSPSVQLTLLPVHTSEYEIRVVEIEGISFYPGERHRRFAGLTFAIAPGADVKDVEVTVRTRMRIRGRVLSADGTPLRNMRVGISIKSRDVDGSGSGGSAGTRDLDPDGYFMEYVNESAYYTVYIRYEGQSAESEEILLKDGERHDDLVLTLDGAPPPKPLPAVARIPDPVRERFKDDEKIARERFKAAETRERQGVWAINPENRHAYKRIHCETREEARAQAAAEGAHLVAINDEAEQEWLLEVFGKEYFWIGLVDASKEDNPHWDNGEPVTYTNWAFPEKITDGEKSRQKDGAHQNYTVLVGLTGKWQETRQESSLASITERAILEKERFAIGFPDLDEGVEKR